MVIVQISRKAPKMKIDSAKTAPADSSFSKTKRLIHTKKVTLAVSTSAFTGEKQVTAQNYHIVSTLT
jgi:hypothetical protein